MLYRVLMVLLCVALPLVGGQPGEKAKGVDFKYKTFTLTVAKVKSTSDQDLGDPSKTRFSFQLEGTLQAPAKPDVAAVLKQFSIKQLLDEKNNPIEMKPSTASGQGLVHNAIVDGVGQVELPRTDLPCDASRIGTMTLSTEVVIVSDHKAAKIPAIVMEDNKDTNLGIQVRITRLSMSKDRELTVELSFDRGDNNPGTPFIEKIIALDKDNKSLGGGRWTEGDPFAKSGAWKCKFKLQGDQIHTAFRLEIATKYDVRGLEFPLKKLFRPELPTSARSEKPGDIGPPPVP